MRLLRFDCVLRGHDDRVMRVPGRLFLECAECGRTTAGWNLDNRDVSGSGVLSGTHSRHVDAFEVVKMCKASWRAFLTHGARVLNACMRRDPSVARG